jgi:hypothetical protein
MLDTTAGRIMRPAVFYWQCEQHVDSLPPFGRLAARFAAFSFSVANYFVAGAGGNFPRFLSSHFQRPWPTAMPPMGNRMADTINRTRNPSQPSS